MANKVLTILELADACGVTKWSIQTWKKKGAPISEPPYDVDAVLAWRKDMPPHGKVSEKKTGDLAEQKIRQMTRWTKLKADHQELQNAIASGQLVDVRDTELALAEQSEAVKRELLNIEIFANSILGIETIEDAASRLRHIGREILARLHTGGECEPINEQSTEHD